MSIGFTFKAKTRKIDALKESVKEMAEESGYGLALNENWLTVSFCTMGDLSMEWERESGLRGQWRQLLFHPCRRRFSRGGNPVSG